VNSSGAEIPASRRKKLSFSCGRLRVPLDYAHPNGQTISIGLIKIHDSEQTAKVGSLLVDPGGPGASGIFLAFDLAGSMSDDILRHFDLVGFDPRGVGLSDPVRCLTDPQRDQLLAANPDVRTAAGFAQAQQLAAGFEQECVQKNGATLTHYTTVDTAKDMDRLRSALGDAQLNYLGFSYGTELGAVYAHLFPGTVRTAVLDGAVDPTTLHRPIAATGDQVEGFEAAFDQFAADCKQRPECQPLGDPRAAVEALARQADSHPIPSSTPGEKRVATGGTVLNATLYALYSQDAWRPLGQALIAAQHGDSADLFQLLDEFTDRSPTGHFGNLLDAFTVISCNDEAVREDPTDAQIKAAAADWAKRYPMFGLGGAAGLFSCQPWAHTRQPIPPETAPTSKPILVVGNLHDPATPYPGAVDLTKALGSAVLLSWDGEGHTSYGQGSSCVDAAVNTYLISDVLPPASTTCPR
jgi:pimeloyl-ACP methyl ester carboxylesterase